MNLSQHNKLMLNVLRYIDKMGTLPEENTLDLLEVSDSLFAPIDSSINNIVQSLQKNEHIVKQSNKWILTRKGVLLVLKLKNS